MSKRRLVLGLATCAGATLVSLAAVSADRTYVSASYSLEIAGVTAFLVKSTDGGGAVAAPVSRGARPDGYPDKSAGSVRFEDAVVQVGLWAPKSLWDWVNAFASPSAPTSKDVSISVLDFNLQQTSKRMLGASSLTSVVFPACDGSGKEPAFVTISLSPSSARETVGKGATSANDPQMAQKVWLPQNFRLTIDGIDTAKVSKIDPITIKHAAGGNPEYSNLGVTMSEVNAASLRQWMNQVLDPAPAARAVALEAKVGAARPAARPIERKGKLELLSAQQQVLLTLSFDGLGPLKLSRDKAEANTDTIKFVKAELYVEKITIAAP